MKADIMFQSNRSHLSYGINGTMRKGRGRTNNSNGVFVDGFFYLTDIGLKMFVNRNMLHFDIKILAGLVKSGMGCHRHNEFRFFYVSFNPCKIPIGFHGKKNAFCSAGRDRAANDVIGLF